MPPASAAVVEGLLRQRVDAIVLVVVDIGGARGGARPRPQHPGRRGGIRPRGAARSSSRSTSTAARARPCGTSPSSATRASCTSPGPRDAPDAIERVRGWRDELAAHRLEVVEPALRRLVGGERLPARARRSTSRPDRRSSSRNDHMSIGVLSALRERGLRVPEDVSVVGFDDVPEAGYLYPPLTTVRQDFAALGELIMQKVLIAVEEPDTVTEDTPLPTHLIVRQSTQRARCALTRRPRDPVTGWIACASPSPARPASSAPSSPANSATRATTVDRNGRRRHRAAPDSSRSTSPTTARSIDALDGVDDRHDGVRRASCTSRRSRPPASGATSRPSTTTCSATFNVFWAAVRLGITSHRLRVERDRARPAVRRAAAVHPGRRGVPGRGPSRSTRSSSTSRSSWRSSSCGGIPSSSITALRFSNVMVPEDYAEFPSFDADAPLRKWNLWGYIDARDGAQAVERALEVAAPGFDRFIIAAADTVMSRPNAELVAEVFPGVPVTRRVRRARHAALDRQGPPPARLRAAHSWRDHV